MPAASLTAPSPARAWKLLSSPERSVPTEAFSAPVSGSYCARPPAEQVKQCQPRRARASPPSLRISAPASPFPEPPPYRGAASYRHEFVRHGRAAAWHTETWASGPEVVSLFRGTAVPDE